MIRDRSTAERPGSGGKRDFSLEHEFHTFKGLPMGMVIDLDLHLLHHQTIALPNLISV